MINMIYVEFNNTCIFVLILFVKALSHASKIVVFVCIEKYSHQQQ